jgi:hypothetical protein
MVDVPLLLVSCPRRLATISHQPLTAGFSWYSSLAVSSWAELTNCRLSSNCCLQTDWQLEADSFIKRMHGPHRKHFFLQLLSWCVWCSVVCPIVALPSAWLRTVWKTLHLAASSLLHDVIAVTETRLSCYCLTTCLGFQQTCYNVHTSW